LFALPQIGTRQGTKPDSRRGGIGTSREYEEVIGLCLHLPFQRHPIENHADGKTRVAEGCPKQTCQGLQVFWFVRPGQLQSVLNRRHVR